MMILGIAVPGWLRSASETVLGVVLAVVPLAMRIAWTPALLLGVLATGGLCAALLIAISALSDDDRDAMQATQTDAAHAVVPDPFVEELHRLFPLVYHHSRREKPRFRRVMEKLRRLIR
jgi:hypothetical protein